MVPEAILSGLNDAQRSAVEAVRGPVCILAGAGTGKTTTITRRIAYQVATEAFEPEQLLAVTFTDKAATQLRARLGELGVTGARASTFHSAALAQLRQHSPAPPQQILASKALPLRRIGNRLPRPYRFRPAVDLATEVEWAKNRRISPDAYLAAVGGREPPVPAELMASVYRDYERRKDAAGYVDFEDLLELAIRVFDEDALALQAVRAEYQAFTVDEYQDVNLLQQTLLERWLGDREELCCVGDDYQAIYGFTGASPEHLLALPRRFPSATVVRLEENYRSTPQVLELANRLVPRLGGAEKTLRAVRRAGAEPIVRPFGTGEEEAAWIVGRIHALTAEGLEQEEMAVLCRTNARLADFEEALAEAEIPSQGAALLERDAARQLLKALRADGVRAPAAEVRRVAREHGLLEDPPARLGERELTRQNDLARLVRLAEEFDDGTQGVSGFVAEVRRRFGHGGEAACGVHLLTYHRAKGLEFDAVFLPRLEHRELPWRLAKTADEVAEERRLLYVGLTRARLHVAVTWASRPSRFLAELGVEASPPPAKTREDLPPSFAALKAWRLERARADGIPAYVVFHDSTLAEIAARRPRSEAELSKVAGVGPAKLERYGRDVLVALAAEAEAPAA